jgi:hypothetical protein
MATSTEPLLASPENLKENLNDLKESLSKYDLKESLSKLKVAGWKPGVALALCVLSAGAICYQHVLCTEHVSHAAIGPDLPDLGVDGARGTVQNFLSLPPNKTISPDVGDKTLEEVVALKAEQKEQAEALSAAKAKLEEERLAVEELRSKTAALLVEKDSGDDSDKATMEVLKEVKRDLTGIGGAATCLAAFVFDREASTACARASPVLVEAGTFVLSIYVLFGFAPFYLFPQAATAIGAWKVFPMLESAIMVSPKNEEVSEKMRMALLITAVVAFVSRLFTLWTGRNEKIAIGRQGSMLTSLVVFVIIYLIFNNITAA